jgi:hypothetical protein
MGLDRSNPRARTLDTIRLSRRAAIATGAATAATAAARLATAQDATPEASPADAATQVPFLFVQLFAQGSWQPKPDEAGVYILTLSGSSGQTLYFSDRPQRIVGTVPSEQFLDALGFTPADPPNAALVVTTPEGERDVLVIELFNPVFAETFGSTPSVQVTYEARVLEAYEGERLAPWLAEQEDDFLPTNFTDASLFIDDCPDGTVFCYPGNQSGEPQSIDTVGYCYDKDRICCAPCQEFDQELWNARCNQDLPRLCQSTCVASVGAPWGCT